MSWHVQPELLEQYASGDIDQLQAYSIEAHLPSCEDCRSQIAMLADDVRLARVWAEIGASIDAPARSPVETILVRVGVPEHVARLLGATRGVGKNRVTSRKRRRRGRG